APVVRVSKNCPQPIYQPCLEADYMPYAYPAFGACPCCNDGCFHPCPYYCGGNAYKTQWFHRWLGSHLGHGSMLDSYPCPCIYPTAGKPLHLPLASPASESLP